MSVTPVIGASTTGQSIRTRSISMGFNAGGMGSGVIRNVPKNQAAHSGLPGLPQPASAGTAMIPLPERSSFAAVIVAAGQGLRAGTAVPKQFALWQGKPVLRHAAE